MAAQSNYFQRKLYGCNKNIKRLKIELKHDTSEEVFLAILKFMYSGQFCIKNASTDTFMNVIELVHEYEIEILEESIAKEMEPYIKPKNVYKLLKDANLRNLESVRKRCIKLLSDQLNKITENQEFYEISVEDVCDIVKVKPELSEIKVFQVVKEWLAYNFKCSNEEKAKLLSQINFSRLSLHQLKNVVAPTKIMDDNQLNELTNAKLASQNKGKTSDLSVKDGKISLTYSKKYATPIKMGDWFIINVDLGSKVLINHIKLNFAYATRYCIEISLDDKNYSKIIDYFKYDCQKEQILYFPEVQTIFLQIRSSSMFHCNGLFITHDSNPREIKVGNVLCPTENVVQPETAISHILFTTPSLMNGTMEHGIRTPYVALPINSHKSIEIRFFQPFWLSSCRMRLWDYDGTKYVVRIGCKSNSDDDSFDEIALLEWVKGWQCVEFKPRVVVSFIIEAENASKGNELRIVHFEAPSQKFDSHSK